MGWGIRRTPAWKTRTAALYLSAALVTAPLLSNAAIADTYTGIAGTAGQDGFWSDMTGASGGAGGTNGNGGSAPTGGGKTDSQTFVSLGLRGALAGAFGDGRITPRADIAWQHAFDRFLPAQSLTLTDAAQGFTVLGSPLNQDSAAVWAGLDIAIAPDAVLNLDYDGSFGSRAQSHAVMGGLRLKF